MDTKVFTRIWSMLSFLIIISCQINGDYYCCLFENDSLCECINKGPYYWIWSGAGPADTSGIDDFGPNDGTIKYEYLQSPSSGDAELITQPINLNDGDVISLSTYRHTSLAATQILFTFVRSDTLLEVELFKDFQSSGWIEESITCGAQIQCCLTYPCKGRFHISGTLGGTSNELIAFTNFKVNGCIAQTTSIVTTTSETTTITLPTVTPTTPISRNSSSFCNRFESIVDEWTLQNWNLSLDSQPDWTLIPQFSHSSEYAWTQNEDGAKLTSPSVLIDINTKYSFSYFVHTDNIDIDNSLIVYFYDTDANRIHPLNLFQDTRGNWSTYDGECNSQTPCCDHYPCYGQMVWEASLLVMCYTQYVNVLYAIDDLQLNDGCLNTVMCCDFELTNVCYAKSEGDSLDSTWVWSGDEAPQLTVPPSDGNYMWWKLQNTSIASESTLQSDLFTMQTNSTITASYYIYIEDDASSELLIRFHRQSDDEVFALDFLGASSSNWFEYSVMCSSTRTKCCNDDNGCKGWMEFNAITDGGTETIFAIDSIQVDSDCSPSKFM